MEHEIHPGEILESLKQTIAGFAPEPHEQEVGTVIQAGDGIARAWGLNRIMAGELVEIDTGATDVSGMVLNLEEETVGIVLFSDYELVNEGQTVRRTNRVAEVPAGEGLLGRVVDSLGNPIDGAGPIEAQATRQVEVKGPGIIDRRNVSEPLQTGIKAIDAMVPIGRGQRELIIGDRRTGKTTIAVDTIINQRAADGEEPVYCFYVAIGQKRSSVVQLIETLRKHGAMEYTTVIAATASDPAALQYLAPYAGMAMAEYFRDSGKHALVVFDDLTKHAQAYRQLSLLLRRSPGREAYPGDVFYLHSRLLERAAKLSDALGSGSLTALPIVETQEGDVSAYIPTNVISITDGQMFLEADLFNSGLRPAINVGISVSRVGGDAQVKAMKQTASSLRIDLAQFRELAAFMQFSSDLDPATRKQLDRGERLTEILKQRQYAPIDAFKQVMILKAGTSGRLDAYPTETLASYERALYEFLDSDAADFMTKLRTAGGFDAELDSAAEELFDRFEEKFDPNKAQRDIDSGYTTKMAIAMRERGAPVSRDVVRLIERIASHDLASPSLESEVEHIVSGTDEQETDRFLKLIGNCQIVDYDRSRAMEGAFRTASRFLASGISGLDAKTILAKLLEREKTSSTALTPFFALPHIVVEGEGQFEMVVIRSARGITFSESAPEVHALFVLAGSLDQRHFHLVVISSLAQIVNHPSFETGWANAASHDELRALLRELADKKR